MSEATSIQKWGSYDQDEAERDKKETETKGVFFKITKEKTSLRFLPPLRGQKNPFVKTYQHFVNLVDGDDRSRVVFNCPRKMMNRHCPLCAMAEKKRATGREDDRDRAYDLFPKLRVYAAIVDRSDPDKGVQIYPIGKKIFSALLAIREDGDFTHPISGFDIAILKKGSKKNDTEYTVKAYRKDSKLSDDGEQFNEWIDSIPDLTKYAFVPSAEEIDQKLAAAQDAADGVSDDEAPAPRRGGGGREERRGSGGASTGGGGRERSSRERPIETQGETVAEDVWGNDAEDDLPY